MPEGAGADVRASPRQSPDSLPLFSFCPRSVRHPILHVVCRMSCDPCGVFDVLCASRRYLARPPCTNKHF